MKSKFFIFILLSLLTFTALAQQKPRIAVHMTGNDSVSELLNRRIMRDLFTDGRFQLVERSEEFLAAISKEQKYQRSGQVDEKKIAALGKQLGVQYVCVGSVLDLNRDEKYITARTIDVKSAEVISSCSSCGSLASANKADGLFPTFSKELKESFNFSKLSSLPKVAVSVISSDDQKVDIILGNQLVAALAKSSKYIAVERSSAFLSQLSREASYQRSGAVDDRTIAAIGKQLGAQYVCVAKSKKIGNLFYIDVRLINVETAEIVGFFSDESRLASLSDLTQLTKFVTNKLIGEEIYIVPDINPQFPGGDEALYEFLAENTQFPHIARDNGVMAKVYVQFVVEKDGEITSVKINKVQLKKPTSTVQGNQANEPTATDDEIKAAFEQESMRVVKSMPRWIAGKVGGYPVRSQFVLPFSFTLK